MFIIADKRKTDLMLVLVSFVAIVLLVEFFLSKIETEGVWEWALLSVAFFFGVPFFVIKKLWKKKLKDYFLSLDITKKSIFVALSLVLVYVAVVWLLVVQLDWKGHLMVSRWVLGNVDFLLFVDLVLAPVVIFSREFFFRGFVLKSALGVLGIAGAIVLQAVLITWYDLYITGFSNWSEGWPQILLFLLLNLVLGLVALVTRSVAVTAVISWVHVLFVDLLFVFQLIQAR